MTLNSQRSAGLHLLSAGINGVGHHAQLEYTFHSSETAVSIALIIQLKITYFKGPRTRHHDKTVVNMMQRTYV